MHDFQPFSPTQMDLNPFKLFAQNWAALSVIAEGKRNAMTVSWGGMGEFWNKDVVTVYVRQSRYTKELLDNSEHFSLTFFDEKYRSTLKFLGAVSGREEDKLKGARLHMNVHQEVPFIDEGNFVIICKKLLAVPIPAETFADDLFDGEFYEHGDYHTMYMGEILEFLAR